jgi:glucokinase
MVNSITQQSIIGFPILIGDIGGTNARFAILQDINARPREFPIVATAEFEGINEAIRTSVLDRTSIQPKAAIFAIAGPVDGDETKMTNCDWIVRPRSMIEELGFEGVIILNDFEAQALAAVSLGQEDLKQIGGGAVDAAASRVVVGPGTGLGVAGLVRSDHMWIPVPGEGGHVDLGPRTPRDYALFANLEAIDGRISAEQVLCGAGLVNLYNAICATDGLDGTLKKPADITSAGITGTEKAAVEALMLFATYLGRVAGDLALIFMARGGVYLAGGIVQKILPVLMQPHFRMAFEDKAPHSALLRSIPAFVVTHPLAALYGLASYARTPARFGVSTEGRRWQSGAERT